MRPPPAQISGLVFLKMQTIHHPRSRLRLRFCILFMSCRLHFIRRRILQNQHQPVAPRRPLKILHLLRRFGQLLRLAAFAIQNPNLRLPFLFILAPSALARRKKRQIFPVRAPPRVRRRHLFCGQRNRRPPASRHHPDSLGIFVVFQARGLHHIRAPLPIRTNLRIGHFLQPKIIVRRQNPLRASRCSTSTRRSLRPSSSAQHSRHHQPKRKFAQNHRGPISIFHHRNKFAEYSKILHSLLPLPSPLQSAVILPALTQEGSAAKNLTHAPSRTTQIAAPSFCVCRRFCSCRCLGGRGFSRDKKKRREAPHLKAARIASRFRRRSRTAASHITHPPPAPHPV